MASRTWRKLSGWGEDEEQDEEEEEGGSKFKLSTPSPGRGASVEAVPVDIA